MNYNYKLLITLIGILLFSLNTFSQQDDFVTTWKTDNQGSSNNTSITIPTFPIAGGGAYFYKVDWNNNGLFTDIVNGIDEATNYGGDVTHDFGAPGVYTIRIKGSFPRIFFNDELDAKKIISVDQWGSQQWTSMERAFFGCSNLNGPISDIPDLSMATNMNSMFNKASSFNQAIDSWNVSTITNMDNLFAAATSFNQPLNLWNVSSVTTMNALFNFALAFNQPLSSWNVSSVSSMRNLFGFATNFNQAIDIWNVSSVTDMKSMFISASNFNQALNLWDVSSVEDFSLMFNLASNFNQPINQWNVSSSTNMRRMFKRATSFDQDLGTWDVSNVTNMTEILNGDSLSIPNYDNLLIGWSSLNLQQGLLFDAGNSLYCAGEAARTDIITNDNWTITDGGTDCSNQDLVALCQDITVQLNANGMTSIMDSDIDGGSTGTLASQVASQTSFDCNNLGANNVINTVTDNSGTTATCTAIVTVQDVSNPIATCQDITVTLDQNENATVSGEDINNESTDNCAINSLIISQSAYTSANLGANNTTLTVVDQGGNVSTCISIVTVLSSSNNVTALCQDITVTVDANGSVTIQNSDIDAGSTGDISSQVASQIAFDCANLGANNVINTVTDNSGTTATCTAIVTVQDVSNPIATCQDITVTLDVSENASITSSDIDNASTDNCSVTSLIVSQSAFTNSDLGANNVTLTVVDQSGNVSTCVAIVTVTENSGTLSAICQDITVQLDANGMVTIQNSDIDGGSTGTIVSQVASQTVFDCSNLGDNNVTNTVIDNTGNTSTCIATVTVEDNTNPVITCPANISVNSDAGQCSASIDDIGNPITFDNCAAESSTNNGSSPYSIGTTTVTWTVIDNSENTTTCTQTITVIDNETPIITCPANVSAGTDPGLNTASGVNLGTPATADNCSTVLTISNDAIEPYSIGVTQVTWVVEDVSGNNASCVQTVTVIDGELPPNAVCFDITLSLDENGTVSTGPSNIDGGSSANSGIASMAISQETFNCGDLGDVLVILTVTDNNGNSASCTATVTVIDDISPIAMCNDITIEMTDSGEINISPEDISSATDNCTVEALELNILSFTCDSIGENSVTLTVIDQSMNTAMCSAIVTITDPNGNCPTGIADPIAQENIQVYPNPNNGEFMISFDSYENVYQINIYNSIGEIVYAKTVNNTEELNINLNDNVGGMYMLQIIGDNNITTKAIIVN